MGPPRWAWLSAAESFVDAMWPFQRRDHRATVLTLVRAMVWAADPETMLTKPTLARLMKVTGRSERSVQRWLRKIEASPLVEVIEPGTTPQFRPAWAGQRRNLAREWLLILPPASPANPHGAVRGHPVVSVFSGDSGAVCDDDSPPTRARTRPPRHLRRRRQREGQRQGQGRKDRRYAPGSSPRPAVTPQAPSWPLGQNPRRRRDRLAAAEALRGAHPVLRGISARELRSVLRPWFAAGRTPHDVLWHAEHAPGGEPDRCGHKVRDPASWLRWRLARWTGPDRKPLLPSPSQIRAAAREHGKARQDQRRTETAAAAAQRSQNPAAHAGQLRTQMGWQRGSS
jgi:hypothetical protein